MGFRSFCCLFSTCLAGPGRALPSASRSRRSPQGRLPGGGGSGDCRGCPAKEWPYRSRGFRRATREGCGEGRVYGAGARGRGGRRGPLGVTGPRVKNGRANGFFKISRNQSAHLPALPRARRARPAVGARPAAGPGRASAAAGIRRQGCCRRPEISRPGRARPGAAALRRHCRGLRPGREREPGAGFSQQFRYFVQLPIFTQASLPPLNETPLLRDVQPLHLIKEIALQC